jgi:hypothetical protein
MNVRLVAVSKVHEGLSGGAGFGGTIAGFAAEHHLHGIIELVRATRLDNTPRLGTRDFDLKVQGRAEDVRALAAFLHQAVVSAARRFDRSSSS